MKDLVKKNYAYIVIAVCFLILLYRSFLGFCWTDESFYASTADRFYRGAIPLVDEWYRTQMSSFLMVPFYYIYMVIAGSNTGIILYFRLLYLIFSCIVALLYFTVLRKDYPDHVCVTVSVIIMCYAHLNNATFSYYMMSYLLLMAALILIYDNKNTHKAGTLVIAGVLTALSVLCMPAFAAGYIAVIVLVAIALCVKKLAHVPETFKDRISPGDLLYTLKWTFAGIAVPAVIFVIYLFSKMDIKYLIDTLPYSLVDNEHSNTFGYYIRKPHRCLTEVFGMYTWAMYALVAVSVIFGKFLKKHPFCEIVSLADVILFALMTYVSFGRVGYMQAVFFMFMVPVFAVSEKKNVRLFITMVVPSVLVALIYCFTSSDFLYVMAVGFAIGSSAGVCAVYDLISGNFKTSEEGYGPFRKITALSVTAVCACCAVVTFSLRLTNVYRDAPVSKLNCVIPSGIAKGLYTTEEHLDQYLSVYDAINEYCKGTKGNVLFSKILPWGYMASDLECGYPTTWRATAYNDEQLELYYSINTTARPDVIIVLNEEIGSYDAAGDVEDDHNPNLDEMSDYWKDYISDNGFTKTEVTCGKVYIKNNTGKEE